MTDKITSGETLEGKVTGIQPYGAFVALNNDTQGLVHISEVTDGYVKDIHDYLKVGDQVKVKVLSVDLEHNKVSLSIRATEEAPKQQHVAVNKQAEQTDDDAEGFNTLKSKLEEWIEQSKNN